MLKIGLNFPVRLILNARMLSHFSCAQLFANLWTVACPAPLSMEFSRQEYWSVLPSQPLGGLSNPGIKPSSPVSPALQADSLPTEPPGKPNPYHKVDNFHEKKKKLRLREIQIP